MSSASPSPQNILSKRSSMYDTTAKSVDGATEVDSLATYNASDVNLLSTRDDYSLEVKQ